MKILMNVLMLSVVIVGLCGITDAENIVNRWTCELLDL